MRYLLCLRIEQIKVITKNADHHLRCFSSDRLPNAIAQKGEHFRLNSRDRSQKIADVVVRPFFVFARHWLQFDVEFTAVRSPRIFAKFSAPDLLLDSRDLLSARKQL